MANAKMWCATVGVAMVLAAGLGHAEAPALQKLAPPEGRFFDDPMAVSTDGKSLATISTDAATAASLHVFPLDPKVGKALRVDGVSLTVTALAFLDATHVLVTFKQDGTERVLASVATIGKDAITLDKKRLGPANAIERVIHDGKPMISVYQHVVKKLGGDHVVTLYATDGGKQLAKRVLVETAEGLLRIKSGELRPLWWARAHTQLAAQKIGEYDKAKDIRRPDRFIRVDVTQDKVLVEEEIGDLMKFTKAVLDHKAQPDTEAFVRSSDDRKELVVTDGLVQHALPLQRPISTYSLESLTGFALDDKRLMLALQVEPNNPAALARKSPDVDDLDVYAIDRASIGKTDILVPRLLSVAGQGRSARFAAGGNTLAVLRKAKGFDRGGVGIDVFVLP